MSLVISLPYFADTEGDALDGGYIYIGEPNQNPTLFPRAAFWDADLTIPAVQPIRTLAGYPARNGAPAAIYTSGQHSILVLDQTQQTIYYREENQDRVDEEASVDSIAELRLLDTAVYSKSFVTKYYAADTRPGIGGGHYIVDDADITSADNDGSIIIGVGNKRWKLIYLNVLEASQFGAKDDGTDQTVAVLKAINAIGTRGGLVHIADGIKFNLRSMTFTVPRINLDYRIDDDLSTPNPGGDLASSERIFFSANSSYPADPTGAAVNEWRFTGPFHPGLVVDVRKDVTAANAFLRPGQSLTNPVRSSILMMDEQEGSWKVTYEHFDTFSNFSGVGIHGQRRVYVLNGIGTAAGGWVSVPTENTVITGAISGAKGFLLSVAATSTTVLWFSGKFQTGEALTDDNETTVNTITSTAYSTTSLQPLSQDLKRGNWSVGLPPGAPRDVFAVGGKIGVQQTRSMSQWIEETILHPGYVWVDSYENSPPNGYEIIYDTTAAATARRLNLRKYDTTANIGLVGAMRAAVGFDDALSLSFSRYNIASVVKNATGDYTINFATNFATADYKFSWGSQDPLIFVSFVQKLVGSVRIFVTTTGTNTKVNIPVGQQIDVICHCGDIV